MNEIHVLISDVSQVQYFATDIAYIVTGSHNQTSNLSYLVKKKKIILAQMPLQDEKAKKSNRPCFL